MSVLYFFAEHRNGFLTLLQRIGTSGGSETVLMLLLCVLLWCGGKKLAYRIGFTYFYSCLLIQGLKITFRIPRPWVIDPKFKPLEHALSDATGYSFPSGHSQTGAAVYGTIFLNLKKWWSKAFMVCAILLVGFSRMYAGVHTPLDVSVGIGATVVVAVILHLLYQRCEKNNGSMAPFVITLIVLSVLLFAYVCIMLYGVKLIDLDNARDLAKGAGAGVGFALGYWIEQKKIQFPEERPNLLYCVLRVAAGLGSALLLKSGLKVILNAWELPGDFIRYFILIFWLIAIFTCLFKAWEKKLSSLKK